MGWEAKPDNQLAALQLPLTICVSKVWRLNMLEVE